MVETYDRQARCVLGEHRPNHASTNRHGRQYLWPDRTSGGRYGRQGHDDFSHFSQLEMAILLTSIDV